MNDLQEKQFYNFHKSIWNFKDQNLDFHSGLKIKHFPFRTLENQGNARLTPIYLFM